MRIGIALLCLIAYCFQSFVAQTHIHSSEARYFGSSAQANEPIADSQTALSKDKTRKGSGTNDCPLCQIVLHGGMAPLPTFALALLPASESSFIPFYDEPVGETRSVSFHWRSRGPPLS